MQLLSQLFTNVNEFQAGLQKPVLGDTSSEKLLVGVELNQG